MQSQECGLWTSNLGLELEVTICLAFSIQIVIVSTLIWKKDLKVWERLQNKHQSRLQSEWHPSIYTLSSFVISVLASKQQQPGIQPGQAGASPYYLLLSLWLQASVGFSLTWEKMSGKDTQQADHTYPCASPFTRLHDFSPQSQKLWQYYPHGLS